MSGEVLASFAAKAVLTKLVSVFTEEISLASGLKEGLEILSDKSKLILALLGDAEKRQLKEESVNLWLKKMKDVVYDADDMLDAFAFEMLRRKLEMQNRLRNKARNFFSVSNPIAFHFKVVHKVKNMNMALVRVVEEGRNLGLNQSLHRALESPRTITNHGEFRQTHPFVDDSKVLGREVDKLKVVAMLLQSQSKEDLPVVAIVGLGGLGKTTLAQLVYKDDNVTKHFSHTIWICVSDDFDVTRLLKEMADSLMLSTGGTSNIEAMIQRLKEKLNGKKYLLVLDDVWNTSTEKWERLRNSLLGIGGSKKESMILVTTRSDKVVSTVQARLVHYLANLSEEDSWLIFQQKAFASGGAKETPYLVDIGKNLVERCRGMPLALKTLGALMHSKEEHEWLLIQESNLWELSDEENGLMPTLRLSFNHLPLWLKQCFAYCSLFPKDFKHEKDNLIHLWIAQGFIQPSQEKHLLMEDIGNDYFKSLLWNSFFQDVEVDIYGNITHCKMHDLVHDLARCISKSDCLALDASNQVNIDDTEVRHFSLVDSEGMKQKISNENAIRLRTLCLAGDAHQSILVKFKCLRVLRLEGTNIKKLPTTISKLEHLRYLDVSYTEIRAFPTSITKLYNLQTLRLIGCKKFEEFPRELRNLINLRHLCFDSAKGLFKIGQLPCLQTLPSFAVGQDKGCRIEELGPLSKLRGKLEISNLECVGDKEAARRANLMGKTNVYKLKLAWGDKRKGDNNDEDVLEGLQPPPNLKSLTIEDFGGRKFPAWMTMTSVNKSGRSLLPQNLVELNLIGCQECEHIPTLGELPLLRFLKIEGMYKVKCIGTEFYSYSCVNDSGASSSNGGGTKNKQCTLFPALESFTLKLMINLVEWAEAATSEVGAVVVFPRLKELTIEKCYKLTTAPSHFPTLKKLIIEDISNEVPIARISSKVTTLTSVYIRRVSELTSLPEELLQNNKKSLTFLYIFQCYMLSYIPPHGLHNLVALEVLKIDSCPHLTSIPSIQGLTSLRTLEIFECDGILPIGLGTCTSLETLKMKYCRNLVSLPEEDLRELTSLSTLSIIRCGNLKSFQLEGFLHCLTRLENLEIGAFSEELDSFPFFSSNVDDYIQQHQLQLERLMLYGWEKLKCLPDQVRHFTALRHLHICEFDSLEALPDWLGELTSLQVLHIWDCKNLKYLPSEGAMRQLTNLQDLDVMYSPILDYLGVDPPSIED